MKNTIIASAFIATMLLSFSALAVSPYAAVEGGKAFLGKGESITTGTVTVGAMLTDNFGLEGFMVGGPNLNRTTGLGISHIGVLSSGVNVVGRVAATDAVTLFGGIGPGVMWMYDGSDRSNDLALNVSGGALIALTDAVSLRASVSSASRLRSGLNFNGDRIVNVSLGLQYNF